MKKQILIILVTFGLVSGALAQRTVYGKFGTIGRGQIVRPRVTVIAPRVPVYPGFGLGYNNGFGSRFSPYYSPFYDPFYSPRTQSTPSQLQLQLDDIDNEYDFKISSARNDKSLSREERRQKVRELKYERENKIIDAKKEYYNDDDDRS